MIFDVVHRVFFATKDVDLLFATLLPDPEQVDEDGGLGSSWGEWMIWGLPTPLGALACPTPISGPPDGASVTGDAVIRARGRCVQYTARCVQYTAHVVYVICTVCPRRCHWP